MLWFSKGEKPKKEEIENIKASITKTEEASGVQDFTERFPPREHFEPKDSSPAFPNREEMRRVYQPNYAPLFIKLDKYQTIIKRIKTLDEILRNTIEIMKVNDELERVRNEVIKSLLRNLQEAIKVVNFLDRELVKPLPFEEREEYSYTYTTEVENLEEHLNHLKKQLEELKKYF